MKATKTELAPSIAAVLFNEIESKKVNLDESKVVGWISTMFYEKRESL
jgi:dipeptidyl-peptidase-3